jgi:thioredoxin 1
VVNPIAEEIAKERLGEVEILKLNVDENPGIAAEYGIRSIPTLALMSARASSREGGETPDTGGVGGAR